MPSAVRGRSPPRWRCRSSSPAAWREKLARSSMFQSSSGAWNIGDAIADRIEYHVGMLAPAGLLASANALVLLGENAPRVECLLGIELAAIDVPARSAKI